MIPNPDELQDQNELRRRAEEKLKAKSLAQGNLTSPEDMTSTEVQTLIHELQVHQIELEMQNEELQRTQEQLASAHDRYFDLFDLAPVGYFIIDEKTIIRDVNLAGANLLRVQRGQLLGKSLSHFVHEQDQDIFYLHRRQANQEHRRMECELRLLRNDRSLFYANLELAPITDPTSPTSQLRLIASDITPKVLLEQSLVKDKIILSKAERMAQLGGWEWDIEKNEVSLSEGLQRIYGCEKSCYSMEDFLRLAHPEDRDNKRTALEQALSGASPFQFEHRILRRNDLAERHLQVSGEAILDKTGKVLKFYAASQDVTELKMNERRLKSYTTHLEILNRDLENFTYIASHDLQAPLRKIQKFGEKVKTGLPPHMEREIIENIERIQNTAFRMQALISDLLKYSRIANGVLTIETINLNTIVQEVLDDLEELINNSDAQLEVEELPTLSGEPILMQLLFQNLIGNALKFHQAGKAPFIQIKSTRLSAQMVEICVIDQGIGFDEQHSERIFKPFERLHGVSEYEGTGIGLAICQKIVERHSGTITAHGEPGQGATFIIRLPITPPITLPVDTRSAGSGRG